MENIDNIPDKTRMPTMTELVGELRDKGFIHEFTVNSFGEMISRTSKAYKPSEVKIVDFFRFEGDSDPGDESVLYALETSDGTKGLLSHIYGREISEENAHESKFIKHVMVLNQEHPHAKGSNL